MPAVGLEVAVEELGEHSHLVLFDRQRLQPGKLSDGSDLAPQAGQVVDDVDLLPADPLVGSTPVVGMPWLHARGPWEKGLPGAVPGLLQGGDPGSIDGGGWPIGLPPTLVAR